MQPPQPPSSLCEEISREEEQQLVMRARCGDEQARDALILSCTSYLRYWALCLLSTYRWASSRLEYDDLIQVGYTFALEQFDKALATHQPVAYLRGMMKHEMQRYCYRYASLVVRHYWMGDESPLWVESLDKPLEMEENLTYADTLEAPTEQAVSERDYRSLYHALDLLTPQQRDLVMRYYGLGDYGAYENLKDIGQSRTEGGRVTCSTVSESHSRALKTLRVILGTPERPEPVYSAWQARQVLGVTKSMLSYLTRRYGIERVGMLRFGGIYRKADIDRLAQQRVTPENAQEVYITQQACQVLGVTKSVLSDLTRRSEIERVGHGVYRKADIDRLAQQRAGVAARRATSKVQVSVCTDP